MNFKDVVTKAGFVMGVNWLVGAKLLGAGALLQTSELGGFVDPNHIAGFTYNEIDGGWYETPPSPDLGQFAWEHPASAEKQAQYRPTSRPCYHHRAYPFLSCQWPSTTQGKRFLGQTINHH